MNTAVAHEPNSGRQEPESWPRPDLRLADTERREPDVHSLDATQGQQIGSHPYDDATQGRLLGSRPHDDATRPFGDELRASRASRRCDPGDVARTHRVGWRILSRLS
jgi:hypothetical protein